MYGINKLEVNQKNSSIIDVDFGFGKLPYHIHQSNLNDFCKALLPDYDLFKDYCEKNNGFSLKDANEILKGRAIIFVTDFKEYFEYGNGGQNGIIGVTTLDIDGDFKAKELEDLFNDNVSYREKNPNPTKVEDIEREDN